MNTKPVRVWLNTMIKKYSPKWFLHRLTKCHEILPWMEKKDDLTLWQKIELRFHIIICPPCWDYEKQIKMISSAFKNFFKKEKETADEKRGLQLEEKIISQHCSCEKEKNP